ncbi:uncharacterized protein [Littorina saxatilis]|uniref:Uncharacterized protein n=1 Tax=Littorina saxatilis TaxID=31220 RepID=A0AAN9G0P6_9CAEN
MKQLTGLRTMSTTKQWMPDQEADPGTELKSGDLYLLSSVTENAKSTCKPKRCARYPVHVKVYRSCYGHYAVVTASLRAPATYLNLRTCNCRPCVSSVPESPDSKFRVEMGGGEGQVIYFEVSSRDPGGLEGWVKAFQGTLCPCPGSISPSLSPVIPRSPIMPTLQESIEEEEEEEEVVCGLG